MLGGWVQFYKRANERSGGRAQYGGACNAVGTVTKFSNASSRVVTHWVGLFNYPDKVIGLKVLLGRRLPFGMSVQCRYVFYVPMCANSVSKRLCAGVPFSVIELVDGNDRRNYCCVVTE